MKSPKKSGGAKAGEPLFPSLFKAKPVGGTGGTQKPNVSFKPSPGLRESKGFRPANLIRKGRAGT